MNSPVRQRLTLDAFEQKVMALIAVSAVSYLSDRERDDIKLAWQMGKTPGYIAVIIKQSRIEKSKKVIR